MHPAVIMEFNNDVAAGGSGIGNGAGKKSAKASASGS